ncbi:MAG: nucleotidyltransferase [Bacteroidetes bacterium]|nr:nucleotidyltransferase [Bacteroidota bacterium]MBU1718964.1 nucleotidyltransferase [Bacteroidota bacterium]
MLINKDFREFIECLNKHDAKYLIVGGYAVAFHGHPRYTKDLDVWIWAEADNSKRIIAALHDFGFGSLNLTEKDFQQPEMVVQLGNPPVRIDILTSVSGVAFPECFQSRVTVEIDGLQVNFIDLPSLRTNKKASGRHQDLADLENLK